MNSWYTIFVFSITSTALFLTLLGLWFTAIIPAMDRWSKKFFLAYFTGLMLCSLVSLVDIISVTYFHLGKIEEIFAFFETLFLSTPIPMLTVYLLHCCKKDVKKNYLFRTVLGLWAIFFILLASTLFSDVIYYINPDGQYQRGKWYIFLILSLNAIMILNLVHLIKWRNLLTRKYFLSFFIAMFPLTATLIVHTFIDVTALIDISSVLSAVSMLGIVMSEQIEQNEHQQKEIANQRANVMILQMRPHFIYNTLMSIYSLCNQDPQKARQVTLDFTNYLRKNFTAVASEKPITFSAELEHTRAYLAVEQAQYDDMLFVEYDIRFSQFRLPPLTLQPIVENAVKHGMNPYDGPLRVFIKTYHTDEGNLITVEDTGTGYGKNDNNDPHIALANIKERLKMMCNGTLTISPRESGGTTVTVFIPNRIPED
ncbi:MAG: hypothetical protein E7571_03870 [Ruminococcaceae bacterium]|nr:hypothetical protein [Oscillospiraceae bacterium]